MDLSAIRTQVILPAGDWFCQDCLEDMTYISEQDCAKCSRALHERPDKFKQKVDGHTYCYDCVRWMRWEEEAAGGMVLHKNRSVLVYNDWTQAQITQYKFRGDQRWSYVWASLLIEQVSKDFQGQGVAPDYELIVSIPLSVNRQQERGFNQASLIAEHLAQHWKIQYAEHILKRLDMHTKQSKLGRSERLEEMLSRFINNPSRSVDIKDKKVLIVDDIYTTGATLHAAAYRLKQAGARCVEACTVAR